MMKKKPIIEKILKKKLKLRLLQVVFIALNLMMTFSIFYLDKPGYSDIATKPLCRGRRDGFYMEYFDTCSNYIVYINLFLGLILILLSILFLNMLKGKSESLNKYISRYSRSMVIASLISAFITLLIVSSFEIDRLLVTILVLLVVFLIYIGVSVVGNKENRSVKGGGRRTE